MKTSELLAKAETALTVVSRCRDACECLSDAVNDFLASPQKDSQLLDEVNIARSEATTAIQAAEVATKVFDTEECRAAMSAEADEGADDTRRMMISMLRSHHRSCLDDMEAIKQRLARTMEQLDVTFQHLEQQE